MSLASLRLQSSNGEVNSEGVDSFAPAHLKLVRFPARSPLPIAALPSTSLFPKAPLYLACSRSARPLPSRLYRPCRSSRSLHCWLWFIRNEATISASSAHDSRTDENDRLMSKARERKHEMLREYDFSQGIRGKYARRYTKSSNVVVLEPDVAEVFPDAQAVNSSLRSLAEIIRRRNSTVAK